MTPNDPGMTFDPITKVDGLTLMNMYESYGHAVYHVRIKAFLVKMTFWPQWPQMTQDLRLTPKHR